MRRCSLGEESCWYVELQHLVHKKEQLSGGFVFSGMSIAFD
jgi:hypothetical protein